LPSAFVRKLSAFTRLSDEDKQLLLRVVNERSRKVAAGCNVSREGDVTRAITIIEAGWAVQYRSLDDGRRQILTLMLPGDIFDLNILLLDRMDYSVVTKTGAQISEISVEGFDALMGGHPRVRQALWWEQLVQHSIQKEWTINLGQRTAYERMAHLFCEVFTRLRIVGLTDSTSCDFPLTQNDLGEIAGLSPVHVNRTLQALRAGRIAELAAVDRAVGDGRGPVDARKRAELSHVHGDFRAREQHRCLGAERLLEVCGRHRSELCLPGFDQSRGLAGGGLQNLLRDEQRARLENGHQDGDQRQRDERKLDRRRSGLVPQKVSRFRES
jgi:CRP-like cAMP-binding protein